MNFDAVLEGFHFLRPWWWSLLPFLLLMLWYLRRIKLQGRHWQTVCDAELLPHLLISESGTRQRRGVLVMTALVGVLAITALAGPAWKQLEQPVFRDQSALVLLLDLSRSMDATDVKPTRLTRARLKLIDILKQRKEGQSALIVFAADPFVVSPLTEDSGTIIAQVSALKTTLMPEQGSRPDLAIDMAQQLLVQAGVPRGELLLISDGLEKVPMESIKTAVDELVQAGYRLSILGVGSAEGAPIALPDGGFHKDHNGAIVIPRLDATALRELAQQGGGQYQPMRVDDGDIDVLLGSGWLEHDLSLEASQSFKADLWREEGPWLLLLLLPLVLVVFRRGYLCLACLLLLPLMLSPNSVQAAEAQSPSWWSSLWLTPDQRALREFEAGDVAQAAKLFENSAWQAAAHYRSGNYQKSIDLLEGIESAEALYNKGNAYAQLKQWQSAFEAYDRALRLQPTHEDAKYNRELVQQQLAQAAGEAQSDQSESGASEESSGQGEPQQGSGQQPSHAGSEGDNASSSPQEEGTSPAAQDAADAARGEQGGREDQQGVPSGESAAPAVDEAPQARAQAQADVSASEASEGDASEADAATATALSEAQSETQQANDQWLRRIPDDPGGLLRRKFEYQSQRERNRSGGQRRSEDEAW